jgi:predicted secreted protein
MANTPIKGDVILLELDTSNTDTPTWAVVGCITESDIDGTRETIDASSKCGPAQLAGQKTDTANFTGFYNTDPEAGEVSMNEIAAAYDDGEIHHWRLIDEDGGDLYYREFRGPITAYNESTNQNEPVTFTASVGINGDIIRTAPTT